jgi:catechol 2,3-dioxygenase-like lactoylglutathione lyase family enzyme
MAQMPQVANTMNHVAYPTTDTGATYRFYTEVLGFPLVAAVSGSYDPESGKTRPHLHTFFASRGGEVIAFFEIDGAAPGPRDDLPTWVRHIAFGVESRQELDAWRERLQGHGVEVTPVVDHDGLWYSIYFMDPNQVLLELTYQSRPLTADDAGRARRMVEEWAAARGQRLS